MRVVFFGTPEFAVPALEALLQSPHQVVAVVAQPDRPAGRGMRLQTPPVAALAQSRGLKLLQPERIREPRFLDEIRTLRPEAGIVVAYGKILPEPLLAIPERGFLNIHASLLPRYRGAAPIQRAIEQGERETGVTIMQADAELDHGPILAAVSAPIGPHEHAPSLSCRMAQLGSRELIGVLDRIDQIEPREQRHEQATYAPKIEKEEGRIDWNASATSIYDRFRAFDPWPGVFTSSFKLTAISPGSPERSEGSGPKSRGPAAEPGTILSITGEGLLVATGRGTVLVSEMQRPGKRPARAAELARSASLREGAAFP